MLIPEVLYEICCFGIGDSARLVSHPAQEIVSLLLQGRLLVAEEVWEELCTALDPVLPVLQVMKIKDSDFYKVFYNFLYTGGIVTNHH